MDTTVAKEWNNSPKSLEDISLNILAETVLSFYVAKTRYGEGCKFLLPSPIIERLLWKISNTKTIDDSLLQFITDCGKSLYQGLNMKQFHLCNVKEGLTENGLACLKDQELHQLTIKTKEHAPINWHPAALRQILCSSTESLKSFKCDYFGMPALCGLNIIDLITMFRNLLHLDLEIHPRNAMLFTDQNWTRILYSCSNLSSLSLWSRHEHCEFSGIDLNFCPISMKLGFRTLRLHAAFFGVQPLFKLFRPVKDLTSIASFSSLRHLDLSIDIDPRMYSMDGIQGDLISQALFAHRDYASNVKDFLNAAGDKLPQLQYLDISGLYDIANCYIEPFVKNHPKLEFLGLFMTDTNYSQDADCQGQLTITGCEIECQILAALECYGTTRRNYALESMKCLYDVSKYWRKLNSYAVCLVLRCLSAFSEDVDFQVAATACLYNLTRAAAYVPDIVLDNIAAATLKVLSKNMSIVQVLKNCLLTFCQDDILQRATFDRFYLARLCLLILRDVPISDDALIVRMSSIILSIVAACLTSKETAVLMRTDEIKLLLSIVKDVHDNENYISTFRFTLSAIWNLTDDCPGSCHLFVNSGGMDLFMSLLQTFETDSNITVKILGALNNVAEVPKLCEILLCDQLLGFITFCLEESNEKSEIYFAGGIIANLLCDTCIELPKKQELINALYESVLRLGPLSLAIVTYRSFQPFHRMLNSDIAAVVLWAIWAIHHVCYTPMCYSSMLNYGKLMDSTGLSLLEKHCKSENEQICTLAEEVTYYVKTGERKIKWNSPETSL